MSDTQKQKLVVPEEIEKYSMDIGHTIKILNDKLQKRANEDLRSIGLTLSQIRALHFIETCENYETTQKELEDFLDVSHPTINGILKRLEEKGRITTELAINHHLTKIVRITQSGLENCKNSEYARLKSENILERNLSPEEKATLLQLLKKVQQSLIEEENK